MIDGESEVKGFFEEGRRNHEVRGLVAGFMNFLERIANFGVSDLTEKQFKSWRQSGEMLSKLHKGKHRIAAFIFKRRLVLLATCFDKTKDKESAEYVYTHCD
jgi:hypothetical protein